MVYPGLLLVAGGQTGMLVRGEWLAHWSFTLPSRSDTAAFPSSESPRTKAGRFWGIA